MKTEWHITENGYTFRIRKVKTGGQFYYRDSLWRFKRNRTNVIINYRISYNKIYLDSALTLKRAKQLCKLHALKKSIKFAVEIDWQIYNNLKDRLHYCTAS